LRRDGRRAQHGRYRVGEQAERYRCKDCFCGSIDHFFLFFFVAALLNGLGGNAVFGTLIIAFIALRKRLRIPMMSITQSDLMPISAERSDAGLSQCERVIDISQDVCWFSARFCVQGAGLLQ